MAQGTKGSINNIRANCYLLGFLEGKSSGGKEEKAQAGSCRAVLKATNDLPSELQQGLRLK